MKLLLLAVGRMRSAPLQTICDDYLSRLKRFGPADVQEVKASAASTADRAVADENARLLEELEPSDKVWVLDERGAQPASVELSKMIQTEELRATKRLVLVLGGAYGLNDEVRKRGKLVALSKLTLPHELCRVLILEQLYRARTIQHNQPYHHG